MHHLLLASTTITEDVVDTTVDTAQDVTSSAIDQFKSMSDLFAIFNLGNLLTVGVRILVIFLMLTALYQVIKRVLNTSYKTRVVRVAPGTEARKQMDTFHNLTSSSLFYIFLALGLVSCLGIFGFDVKSLATSAGIAGAAMVLVSQDLIKDWVGGFFILIDRQFDVGDYVCVGATTGEVKEITIRHTVIATDNNELVTIPNGDIHIVINYSKEPVVEFYDVRIHDATRLEEGLEALKKACDKVNNEYANVLSDPVMILGVQQLVGTAAVIRLRFKSSKNDTYPILRTLRAECLFAIREVGLEMQLSRKE